MRKGVSLCSVVRVDLWVVGELGLGGMLGVDELVWRGVVEDMDMDELLRLLG